MFLLSEDEHMVLLGLCRGATAEQLSDSLELSIRTIDGIRLKIKKRFGCSTLGGLMVEALKHGYFNSLLRPVVPRQYILREKERLTLAEGLYLHCVLSGFTRKEIAEQMDCNVLKITHYRRTLNKKWKIKGIHDLVLKSVYKGYLTLQRHTLFDRKFIGDRELILYWDSIRKSNSGKLENGVFMLFDVVFDVPRFHAMTLKVRQWRELAMRLSGESTETLAHSIGVQKDSLQKSHRRLRDLLKAHNPVELIKTSHDLGLIRIIPDTSPVDTSHHDAEILRMLGESSTIKAIATRLNWTSNDVSIAIHRLSLVWRVHTVEALILKAYCYGVLEYPDG